MAEGSGVSASYVDSQIARLKDYIDRRSDALERQIDQLEDEMRELAREMVNAIEKQTSSLSEDIQFQTKALAAEAAATVAMLEATRRSLVEKLEIQTEAGLQVEIGKKIGEVKATHAKILAFSRDIDLRFQKSIESAGVNTALYDANFKKIFDEYENKIRTIGSHIFEIWENVIQPAQKVAAVDPDAFFRDAIDVDLKRLHVRAQNLDGTLALLKSARLDEILNSMGALDSRLDNEFAAASQPVAREMGLVEAISCISEGKSSLAIDVAAEGAGPSSATRFREPQQGLEAYTSAAAIDKVVATVGQKVARAPTDGELEELAVAAQQLLARNVISTEDMMMLLDFLEQEELEVVQ
jgi:hypothetical protein